MLTTFFRLCGWLFYVLGGMAVVWVFCLVPLVLEHSSSAYEFFSHMSVVVGVFGLIAVTCLLLGKGCFWLSTRFTEAVCKPSPTEAATNQTS